LSRSEVSKPFQKPLLAKNYRQSQQDSALNAPKCFKRSCNPLPQENACFSLSSPSPASPSISQFHTIPFKTSVIASKQLVLKASQFIRYRQSLEFHTNSPEITSNSPVSPPTKHRRSLTLVALRSSMMWKIAKILRIFTQIIWLRQ
jgi:hypothetical protein